MASTTWAIFADQRDTALCAGVTPAGSTPTFEGDERLRYAVPTAWRCGALEAGLNQALSIKTSCVVLEISDSSPPITTGNGHGPRRIGNHQAMSGSSLAVDSVKRP